MMSPKRIILAVATIFLFSCSHGIETIDGSLSSGTRVYHYKVKTLKKDENIVIGKIKVIDKAGLLGYPGQDIANKCRFAIYDNHSFLKERFDIENPNLIYSQNYPDKFDESNNYNGFFATKVRGEDIYIYGIKCSNKNKYDQNFLKSNFYIQNSGEQVIEYKASITSYLKAKSYGNIYDIGSYVFVIDDITNINSKKAAQAARLIKKETKKKAKIHIIEGSDSKSLKLKKAKNKKAKSLRSQEINKLSKPNISFFLLKIENDSAKNESKIINGLEELKYKKRKPTFYKAGFSIKLSRPKDF